ncbi:MAG: response regulator [Planctomycetes bacterium]|nr:response regulator [Planctomycetota bacterium]
MVLRILHVEDNAGDAQLLREALEMLGPEIEVQAATRADTALEIYRHGGKRFDLIILDLNLPGGGGLDLLRQLRAEQRQPCPRIVILSGSEVPTERRQATDADAFLIKPTDWAQWETLGRNLLRAVGVQGTQRPGTHRTPLPREHTSQILRRIRRV